MKNVFDVIRTALAILVMGFLVNVSAFAQGTPGQGTPGDGGPAPTNPDPDPAEIPIDGGASLLVAGGVAYGLKKLRDHRKNRK